MRKRGIPVTSRLEKQLGDLALRLTGERLVHPPEKDVREHVDEYYLGAGYWRAYHDRDTNRIYLVNPDYNDQTIAEVEFAMRVLLHATDREDSYR